MDEPKLHLWDTGVIRITRHPQALGQLLWCLAHTLWIGNSFMLVTSAALVAHHAFGIWHGDYRLRRKWGDVRSPHSPSLSFRPMLSLSKPAPPKIIPGPTMLPDVPLPAWPDPIRPSAFA